MQQMLEQQDTPGRAESIAAVQALLPSYAPGRLHDPDLSCQAATHSATQPLPAHGSQPAAQVERPHENPARGSQHPAALPSLQLVPGARSLTPPIITFLPQSQVLAHAASLLPAHAAAGIPSNGVRALCDPNLAALTDLSTCTTPAQADDLEGSYQNRADLSTCTTPAQADAPEGSIQNRAVRDQLATRSAPAAAASGQDFNVTHADHTFGEDVSGPDTDQNLSLSAGTDSPDTLLLQHELPPLTPRTQDAAMVHSAVQVTAQVSSRAFADSDPPLDDSSALHDGRTQRHPLFPARCHTLRTPSLATAIAPAGAVRALIPAAIHPYPNSQAATPTAATAHSSHQSPFCMHVDLACTVPDTPSSSALSHSARTTPRGDLQLPAPLRTPPANTPHLPSASGAVRSNGGPATAVAACLPAEVACLPAAAACLPTAARPLKRPQLAFKRVHFTDAYPSAAQHAAGNAEDPADDAAASEPVQKCARAEVSRRAPPPLHSQQRQHQWPSLNCNTDPAADKNTSTTPPALLAANEHPPAAPTARRPQLAVRRTVPSTDQPSTDQPETFEEHGTGAFVAPRTCADIPGSHGVEVCGGDMRQLHPALEQELDGIEEAAADMVAGECSEARLPVITQVRSA